MSKIKSDYNKWAFEYDQNINPTRDLDKIATKKSLHNIDFSFVLELGCGTGKNTQWLITKARKLIGIDFSESMLNIAKKKVVSKKAIFLNADLNKQWNVKDNSFDLATINLVLEHIKELDHIFYSLFSKLKKGGKCFICEIHPKKQLKGTRARFKVNQLETTLDTFLHSEKDYIQSAEMAGLKLLNKSNWYENENDNPRLISFLFEKPM